MHEQTTIKILIAKVGLDGHDRGAIVLTKALREQGFEALYSGLRRTPSDIARMAAEYRVNCIGLSSLAGAHLELFPRVMQALDDAGWSGLAIAGGVIPDADIPVLRRIGISAVFSPYEPISAAAEYIRREIARTAAGSGGGL